MGEEVKENVTKKKKNGVMLVIVASLLILFTSFAILYFSNPSIKRSFDNTIVNLPVIGGYLQKKPSSEEEEKRRNMLAQYYSSLDNERAVDKLRLLKNEDRNLYNDMVLRMKSINFNKTNAVEKLIREQEIEKDLVQREIDNMKDEILAQIKSEADYYSNLNTADAVRELESKILNLEMSFEDARKVIENIPAEKSAQILYYMKDEIAKVISDDFEKTYAQSYKKADLAYKNKLRDSSKKAKIYSNKQIDAAVKELQDKNLYNAQDLSDIFINMDYLKVVKLLVEFEDESYVNEILSQLKDIEDLNSKKMPVEGFSNSVNKGLRIFREYQSDVESLVGSYEKMTSAQIASIVLKMTGSQQVFREYKIDDENSIIITEEELILEILKKLKPKVLSQVMQSLGDDKGAEITRKLGLPDISTN